MHWGNEQETVTVSQADVPEIASAIAHAGVAVGKLLLIDGTQTMNRHKRSNGKMSKSQRPTEMVTGCWDETI